MDDALASFEVTSNGDKEIFWYKLSKENAWSNAFAKQAFLEYKKFLFLVKTTHFRCVPSKIVDKVWHLHMTFTHSYWHELCLNTLRMEIHHNPSSNNKSAINNDLEAYKETLRIYEKTFGYKAPSTFWPKPRSKTSYKWLPLEIAFVSTILLTACTPNSFDDITLIAKWLIGIYAIYKILSWLGKGGGGNSGGSCSGSSCGSSCGGGD